LVPTVLTHDLRDGSQGVACIDRSKKPHAGVAKVRDRIERDVVDGFSEHDVKHQEVVDGLPRMTQRTGELCGTVEWVAGPGEPNVRRRLALGDRSGHRMHELRTDLEILEKIAWVGLRHVVSSVAKNRL
jgi:hypothetical protein